MARSKTLEDFFGKQAQALKRLLRKNKTTKARTVRIGGVERRHNAVMDSVAAQSKRVVMRNRSPRKK